MRVISDEQTSVCISNGRSFIAHAYFSDTMLSKSTLNATLTEGFTEDSAVSVSESESSFVSAESENSPPIVSNQSEVAPSSSTQDASDVSSSISGKEQLTPLARRKIALHTPVGVAAPLTSSQQASYFSVQPASSGLEPRSPFNKKPPASRSSHGIETRSGPPPALSTQRSYNADSPWRASPKSPQAPIQSNVRAGMDSERRTAGLPKAQSRRNMGADRRSLDTMATKWRARSAENDDEDPTVRVNGRHAQSSSLDIQPHGYSEDLFLNLASSNTPADDRSNVGSLVERRRVSCPLSPYWTLFGCHIDCLAGISR